MIHDEICTYEVCELAKEKGFDWMPSMYFHSGVERDLREVGVNGANPNKIPHSPHISCPTQTQLQRWLREEKGVVVIPYFQSVLKRWSATYELLPPRHIKYTFIDLRKDFRTYELALEDALKYALANLT